MKKQMNTGMLLLVTSLTLSACSNSNTVENHADVSKTLRLMEMSEVSSMDTIFTQDEPSVNAQSNVFEGLYELDKEDKIIPAAAKELPEQSVDGKTLYYSTSTRWPMVKR